MAAASAATSRLPVQVQDHGDVVGAGFGVEPVQEPQPALGEGQRQDPAGRSAGPAGGRWPAPSSRVSARAGHGGLFKHGAQRRGRAGAVPQQGHQPGGQQGVPAEVEEVVLQPHGVEAQDFLEGFGHDPFPLVARGGGGGFLFRDRQGAGVQLAVGRQRAWTGICVMAAGTM